MPFFGGSSSSRSTRLEQTGQQTAAENSAAHRILQGGRSQSAVAGGVNVGARGNLGGYTFGNVAEGATISLTQTDNGAVQAAQDAIERIIANQANTVSAALGSLGNLTETRITDGANLSTKTASTAIVAVAIIGALLAVVFIFRR